MSQEQHSPLGASGAYRWMACPGSVGLAGQLPKPEASEYAIEGTTAHALAALSLETGRDPWQFIGQTYEKTGITYSAEMSMAVCEYVLGIRSAHKRIEQNNIEHSFHCPTIHKQFFGTADFWALERRKLHVWDYKHGAGVAVDVVRNPQTMYYGTGVLESLALWDKVDEVTLHIVQPRCPFYGGTSREWSLSTKDLWTWVEEILIPAMKKTETSDELNSGMHCRFCPVMPVGCPQILEDLKEFEEFMTREVTQYSNEELARMLDVGDVIKMVQKHANENAFTRMNKDAIIPGRKLAQGKTRRVWRDGAEEAAREEFGKQALEPAKVKSPAQIEKLPGGADFVARFAYTPNVGLQVVRADDSRPGVSKATKSLFTDLTKKGKK